ncbi:MULTISPECIES: thioesterase family protein [unclassified Nocardioides]|uniref:thioesterase family protein n=1 Tax=unclassified Nocardioides TaxID=2615069 RepID=UPI000AFF6E5A|nr:MULTISPECIES: thioesterase family protein [unclassified Nocardioides]
MRNSPKPSFDDVRALCAIAEGHVAPDLTDGNGHMNVRHIYALGVTGADLLSEQVGIDDEYRSSRRMGTFAAEHHIGFFAELHERDLFSVHPVWIDRSERAAHVLVFVLNQTTRALSSILELVVVNVDLESRSAVALPPDVAAQIDRGIAVSRSISWPLPTSGAMSVRR